jgi:hypothetical protein
MGMEEKNNHNQGFTKRQLAQLKAFFETSKKETVSELQDFTRSTVKAEITASEARMKVYIHEAVSTAIKTEVPPIVRRELMEVLDQNILPVLDDHDRRLCRLEKRFA